MSYICGVNSKMQALGIGVFRHAFNEKKIS